MDGDTNCWTGGGGGWTSLSHVIESIFLTFYKKKVSSWKFDAWMNVNNGGGNLSFEFWWY
jgi:hypothetical protein